MNISDDGIKHIEQRESSKLVMYRDRAGIPTIGVGHRLTKDELSSGKLHLPNSSVDWHQGLTQPQVDELLRQDLDIAELAVDRGFGVLVNPTQGQHDSLVSFVFNIGTVAFQNSTLLKKIYAGDLAAVPEQMRRWIHDAGSIDPVLVKRREDEIRQWEGQ